MIIIMVLSLALKELGLKQDQVFVGAVRCGLRKLLTDLQLSKHLGPGGSCLSVAARQLPRHLQPLPQQLPNPSIENNCTLRGERLHTAQEYICH
jgi:hypothetical protein